MQITPPQPHLLSNARALIRIDRGVMSEVDLKKKYLKRAHHLIQGDGRNTKRGGRLQASVEPIRGGKERRVKHTTEKRHGSESCSDSDSLSLASHRSSSSQLAFFDPPNSPPLEMKSMLSPSSRFSSAFQHSYPRTSLSTPTLRQTCKRLAPNSPERRTTLDPSELESQLQIQTDVNRELKRLLVASVGSDLEHRLQQIVQEKAELSQDLNASLQEVMSNHEELDQVSIECDIWRSKFIASRVMIDELASWKAELSLQLRESRKALQYMLHERGDVCREVTECSTHLQRALSEVERLTHHSCSHHVKSNSAKVAAVSPVQYSLKATSLMGENHSNATVLDLAHQNTIAARELALKVTVEEVDGGIQSRTAPSPPCIVEPTAGERLAQRVMSYRVDSQRAREMSPSLPKLLLTDEDLVHRRSTAASVGSSLPPLSRKLFHFGAKALEDPYDFPFHCAKCRGKIMVV